MNAGHTTDQFIALQTLLSTKEASPKRYNPVTQGTLLASLLPWRPLQATVQGGQEQSEPSAQHPPAKEIEIKLGKQRREAHREKSFCKACRDPLKYSVES